MRVVEEGKHLKYKYKNTKNEKCKTEQEHCENKICQKLYMKITL
jgi:hypothetical protein